MYRPGSCRGCNQYVHTDSLNISMYTHFHSSTKVRNLVIFNGHREFYRRTTAFVPFPSPGDLPNPWIKPRSSTLQADSLLSEPLETSWDTSSCLFLLSVLSGTSPLSLLSCCPTLQTGHLILFPFWCNAAHLGSLHLSTSSSRSPLRAQFPTEVLKIIEKDESFPGRRILL